MYMFTLTWIRAPLTDKEQGSFYNQQNQKTVQRNYKTRQKSLFGKYFSRSSSRCLAIFGLLKSFQI